MKTVRITIEDPTESGHRLGWSNHVTSVDATKTNGYAFKGHFLNDGEYDLPLGAIIVQQARCGSLNRPYDMGDCCRVTPEGLEQIGEALDWRKGF